MPDTLLSLSQVADRYEVARQTVWRWVREGRVPASRIGHSWVIAESDLALLDAENGDSAA